MLKHKYLILLILIIISEAVITGIIPIYRSDLYGALSNKTPQIYEAILYCFIVYFFCDFFQSIKSFFVLKVALKFRTQRTIKVAGIQLLKPSDLDNIPQRIQEDIKISYVNRITVLCEYFISSTIVAQLIYLNRDEPKLILAAAIYTILSVLIAITFNPKLTATEKEVQKGEASFRSSLAAGLNFTSLVVANQSSINAAKVRTGYLLFTKLQLGILTMLPFIILAPALINGTMDFATMMKHQGTFSLLVVNAAILISMYTTLIQGKASEQRVKEIE